MMRKKKRMEAKVSPERNKEKKEGGEGGKVEGAARDRGREPQIEELDDKEKECQEDQLQKSQDEDIR
jgi:hypothetical protein